MSEPEFICPACPWEGDSPDWSDEWERQPICPECGERVESADEMGMAA